MNKLGINVNGPYFMKEYKIVKKGRTYTKFKWTITVTQKESIEKIAKIGLFHPRKMERLVGGINSHKQEQFNPGERNYHILKACQKLELNGKEISSESVSKTVNRNFRYINKVLSILVGIGLLKITREYKNKFTPKLYKLTTHGEKFLMKGVRKSI